MSRLTRQSRSIPRTEHGRFDTGMCPDDLYRRLLAKLTRASRGETRPPITSSDLHHFVYEASARKPNQLPDISFLWNLSAGINDFTKNILIVGWRVSISTLVILHRDHNTSRIRVRAGYTVGMSYAYLRSISCTPFSYTSGC